MAARSKTRILVVEDDLSVRLTISQLLGEQGYEVTAAADGFDALLRLQQKLPHLIVSDLLHAANVGIRIAFYCSTQISRDSSRRVERGI